MNSKSAKIMRSQSGENGYNMATLFCWQ